MIIFSRVLEEAQLLYTWGFGTERTTLETGTVHPNLQACLGVFGCEFVVNAKASPATLYWNLLYNKA